MTGGRSRETATVDVVPIGQPRFAPPDGYAVPPEALRALLHILVTATDHRERGAAG